MLLYKKNMEDKKTENIEQKKLAPVNIPTTMEKMVPKFCTNINMALLKNRNLVLTLAYTEGLESSTNSAIIEKIVIDLEHAKSLNTILTKLLGDIENGTTIFE
jgi:hypothetical protein